MQRKQLLTRLDVVGNLDLKPEEVVDDFFASKNTNESFYKPPNWDSPGDSLQIFVLKARREHEAMMKIKKEWQTNLSRKNAMYENHVRRLSKALNMLRKKFADVNAFIKDCEDKKHDAQTKIIEELEKHADFKEKISINNEQVKHMTDLTEIINSEINEYIKYEKILEDVVEQSESFSSVKQLIDRCDSLLLTQIDISEYEKGKLEEIEEMRKVMAKVTKQAALRVLGMKNDLAELERAYSSARTEVLKWEKQLTSAKDVVQEIDLSRDRTLDVIDNMYRMLCKRQIIPPVIQREDCDQQLVFIDNEFTIYRETLRRLQAKRDAQKKLESGTPLC